MRFPFDEQAQWSREWEQKLASAHGLFKSTGTLESRKAYLDLLREFADMVIGREEPN
jgi:hypothetical protein